MTGTEETDKHYRLCTECLTEKTDEAQHSFQWVIDDYPTEDTFGYKHEECVCGLKRSENTQIDKLDHVHIGITYHPAVKATCQSTGTVEYWTCSSIKCEGKYFSDGDCLVQITELTVPVNPNNHASLKVKDKVNATCSKSGYSGDTWCTKCNILVKKGKTVPATGAHVGTGEYLMDKDQHWKLCSCGQITDKTLHTAVTVNQKAPTLTETGYTGDQVCSACGYVIMKGEEIPMETQPVTVPTAPATTEATEPGIKDDTADESKNDWLVPAVIVLAALSSVTVLLITKRNKKR